MPRKLRDLIDFHQPRFMQISESHCGPAVTQMMLSNLGIDVTQEQVAETGGAEKLIELQGMRVDQLARAVRLLAPQARFYYKDHANIAELVRIVQDYRHPVGVEWQGVFEDESEETETDGNGIEERGETEETDYGHYSLVTKAYRRKRQLIVADPYKDFFSQARIFSFDEFEKRWYDYNEVPDPLTGQPTLVEDYHMMFVIVRRNVSFPARMGMRMF